MSKIKNLVAMMGRTYKNIDTDKTYKFLSHSKIGDQVKIATDSEWFEISHYDLQVFIEKFKEVHGTELMINKPQKQQLMSTSLGGDETMKKLRDILLDNIDKVQKDKGYIDQAQNISNSINTLVNLAKAEIALRTK